MGQMRVLKTVFGITLATVTLMENDSVCGADFYIDPEQGRADGDGSETAPWASLQQVLDDGLVESREPAELPFDGTGALVSRNPGAPVKAGDTLWLRSGDYGGLVIENFYNEETITVRAVDGEIPRFSSVLVRGSSMWHLAGFSVSAEHGDTYEVHTLVDLDSHDWRGPVHDIVIDAFTIRSVADASGWSAADWDTLSCNGIQADGSDHVIRDNVLENVNFGISVGAVRTLVDGNSIDGFAGDGLRGLGDYGVFRYNVVKNCYAVNDNHDDGFQSWSVGDDGSVGTGEVTGVVLRGNVIINYEDENQPHRGTLQGIGCFDGTFVDWVVENNVIITDHWHGITLLGARNSRIVNNTVMDLNDVDPGPPWVRIDAHKDGTPPEGCLIRNNLTTAVSIHDDVEEDHNIIIDDPAALFVNPVAHDLRLLPDADAIDMGSSDLAPELDADRIPRPQGDGVDVGAYEWHEADVTPVDDTDLSPGGDGDEDEGGDAGSLNEGDAAAGGAGCGCRTTGSNTASDVFGALLSLL